MAKGTIAIFFWDGWLGVAPSLINAIRLLTEAGYKVDIITRHSKTEFAKFPHFSSGVRILFCPSPKTQSIVINNIGSSLGDISKSNIIVILKMFFQFLKRVLQKLSGQILFIAERLQFLKFSYNSLKYRKYHCFVGVDKEGLIIATIISFFVKIPVFYWSLEICFLNEFKFIDWDKRLVKHLERICHRKVQLTIIQDKQRAKALMDENRVKSRVAIVPNAPLGRSPKLSSNYFQCKFNLPDFQRIILHMGWISENFLSLEIAKVASKWPDTWTLIFHERARRDPSDPYLRNIQKEGGNHVLLSLDPVPFDELDLLYSSGHIGIFAYNSNSGPNFSLMAGASGKLAHYLKCGLPVICLTLPGLNEIICKYQCGLVVEDLLEVTRAIEIIFNNYDFYKANAVKCYEEIYEFSRHFNQVIKDIENLNI